MLALVDGDEYIRSILLRYSHFEMTKVCAKSKSRPIKIALNESWWLDCSDPRPCTAESVVSNPVQVPPYMAKWKQALRWWDQVQPVPGHIQPVPGHRCSCAEQLACTASPLKPKPSMASCDQLNLLKCHCTGRDSWQSRHCDCRNCPSQSD